MGTTREALALLAITFACACGGRQPTRPAPSDGTTTKTFAPLGIKQDAKAPDRAVILGTDERDGSTVLELPAAEARGVVDVAWVRLGGPARAVGGTSPVTLATGPNPDPAVRVGIYGELAGSTGQPWRAGVWASAILAANTLGKDLTDLRFTATSGGDLGGASASALMAAGFLATMTGAKLDPAATLTGVITPDGTIGPVGGLPERFRAAIEHGKRRLGYPAGLRRARSAKTGEVVDLVALAKRHGAAAVELTSVYDAYELLTGRALPEPLPVPATDMAIDDATGKRIAATYKAWQSRLAEDWSQLVQLQQAGRLPSTLVAMGTFAQQRAARAERLFAQGRIAAAYRAMLEAWVYAASATETYDVLIKLQRGDGTGALEVIERLDALDQALVAVFEKIGALVPATMGDHLVMLAAYQAALRAHGFATFAAGAVATTKQLVATLAGVDRTELASFEVAEQIVAQVAPTTLLIALTVAETARAAERLELERERTVHYVVTVPDVKRLTTSYRAAAAAGLDHVESVLVAPLAEQAGIPLDAARSRLAMREPSYLVAFVLSRPGPASSGVLAELAKRWGDRSLPWNLLELAAGELAYATSAELAVKHASLGIEQDPTTGRITRVAHAKAFAALLARAEHTARANARAARIATGGIPVQARLAYQLASAQREGDVQDRFEALASYWTSSAFSQTAVMLARN